MKKLNKNEFDELVIKNRAQFKLIEEMKTEGHRRRSTGNFNFLIFVDAPKSLTGLDNSDSAISQQWELIENVNFEGESCLKFTYWGQPPLMKHEGQEMVIPTDFFHLVFGRLCEKNPSIFSKRKFNNTIGLENIELH